MKTKTIISILIASSIILFISVSIFLFQREVNSISLPYLGEIQNFVLTSSSDERVGRDDFNDKIWIADFIFTTCGSICPKMTSNMASLHRSYALEDDIRFVSVSVNPEYDSPSVLKGYAKKYNADTSKWYFLTGKRKDIQRLAVESFKVGSVKEPIFHSDRFILVDHKGLIRGYYEGTQMKAVQQLFKDIAKLLKEKHS